MVGSSFRHKPRGNFALQMEFGFLKSRIEVVQNFRLILKP
jgi:hypothetical protein